MATHVAACMDYHSFRDWTKFSGPLIDGTLGKGGEIYGRTIVVLSFIFFNNPEETSGLIFYLH